MDETNSRRGSDDVEGGNSHMNNSAQCPADRRAGKHADQKSTLANESLDNGCFQWYMAFFSCPPICSLSSMMQLGIALVSDAFSVACDRAHSCIHFD